LLREVHMRGYRYWNPRAVDLIVERLAR